MPKPPSLSFFCMLHKRLSQRVVIHTFSNPLHNVGFKLTDGCQLSSSAKSIRDRIGGSGLVLESEVKLGKEVLPPSLFRRELPLRLEIAPGDIVSFHHERRAKYVMPPRAQAVDYCRHFFLLHGLAPFLIIEFPTLECNWMSRLHKDPSNGKV